MDTVVSCCDAVMLVTCTHFWAVVGYSESPYLTTGMPEDAQTVAGINADTSSVSSVTQAVLPTAEAHHHIILRVPHTCKGFLVSLRAIEVALGDIGALDAHLSYLAGGHSFVVLVKGGHLHRQLVKGGKLVDMHCSALQGKVLHRIRCRLPCNITSAQRDDVCICQQVAAL